jgi:hypothetical protein
MPLCGNDMNDSKLDAGLSLSGFHLVVVSVPEPFGFGTPLQQGGKAKVSWLCEALRRQLLGTQVEPTRIGPCRCNRWFGP